MNKNLMKYISSRLRSNDESEPHHSCVQSLLISNQTPNNFEHKQPIKQSRLNQSVRRDKENQDSNIIVADFKTNTDQFKDRCQCGKEIVSLRKSISLLSSKIEQVESKLTICFTKNSQAIDKASASVKQLQQARYQNWSNSKKMENIVSQLQKIQQKNKTQIYKIAQQFNNLKQTLGQYRLEGQRSKTKENYERNRLEDRFQRFIDSFEEQLQNVQLFIKKVQKMQKEVEMNHHVNQYSNFLIDKQRNSRAYSQKDPNRSVESTNISFSRNVEKKFK